ncbi:SpoIIE family protein phosphatase [Anaerospora sp.]|jgi:serine phosphatase RsbU (regulator of sigma subunit)|uniref:SpoIIE family protein phosphatase n=1 Tax=Anaerospora sp. TaxID=1960278 RepID=UPI002898F5C5|nr:SpoIIE family protein phosphatase [Anaerospora sp.]MDF2930112.1 stage sporulation protein [Anaerospora sp.]
MNDHDVTAASQLQAGFKLLIQGKYPDEISVTECSEPLAEVVISFNRLARQLKELYEYTIPLTRGVLNAQRPGKTNFLASGLKELHSKLSHLTWQAQQIEKGDYQQRIDFMGEFSLAFNSMVVKLEEREQLLKGEILIRQKAEQEVRLQNRFITDSIHYAAVIQRSMLPNSELMAGFASASFVIWKPRDIVGGDFYWIVPRVGGFMAAVIDCTGHGVPGAFMTLAVNQMLKAFENKLDLTPADLLTILDEKVRETFYSSGTNHDHLYAGLDMGLVFVNCGERKIVFSGARLPLFHLRNKKIKEISGSRRSIGYEARNRLGKKAANSFQNREITYKDGDRLYLSTDGFFDQHGENDSNPFGMDNFAQLLLENEALPLEEQKNVLMDSLHAYMGSEKQRDDITVIGFEL